MPGEYLSGTAPAPVSYTGFVPIISENCAEDSKEKMASIYLVNIVPKDL